MRIAVANRNESITHAISMLLTSEGDFEVVAELSDPGSLLSNPSVRDADLLLVDPELEDLDLAKVVEQMAELSPSTSVVVLTESDDREYLSAAVDAGAKAYISMDVDPAELVQKLKLVGEGHVVASGDVVNDLSDLAGDDAEDQLPDIEDLSQREVEVVALAAHGASNREIADSLIITENTVRVHLRNIYRKLEIKNRQQLTVYAMQSGLAGSKLSG